jgi:teichuronic acid biosynthesis glycosyltransferase TuaC
VTWTCGSGSLYDTQKLTVVNLATFSTLYPNEANPSHGIFVETRLRHLIASGAVRSRVIAPVPWFPFRHKSFGRYAEYARVPPKEYREHIEVFHPRYLSIPKVGMSLAPKQLAWGAQRSCERLRAEGYDFDVIDAHYFYPDGVAAAIIGKRLNRPVVITARGSDLNHVAEFPRPRALISWAAHQAAALITVSKALKDKLVQIGVEANKVHVLRNGVDLQHFRPIDRAKARANLELGDLPVLASVGNLVPEKGHELVIEALTRLPRAHLLIVGQGVQNSALRSLANKLKVADRVRFLGLLSPSELVEVYGATDVLVLASSREGWANVLLEAMACGTPVVATKVGAATEVIRAPEAGIVVSERTSEALAQGIFYLLRSPPARSATRRYAEQFSWEATTQGQIALFESVIRRCRR